MLCLCIDQQLKLPHLDDNFCLSLSEPVNDFDEGNEYELPVSDPGKSVSMLKSKLTLSTCTGVCKNQGAWGIPPLSENQEGSTPLGFRLQYKPGGGAHTLACTTF